MKAPRGDGRLVALEGSGARADSGGGGGPRVIVFSDRQVIAQGLVGLLPDEWHERAEIAADLAALEAAAFGAESATIVDAANVDAEQAALLTRARGGSVVVLVASIGHSLSPALADDADAILVRDEVEPLTLRVALAVARLGMRLLPRGLSSIAALDAGGVEPPPLGAVAGRALELLADGLRDAEIARELNLSESAVRKLIQRTVRRVGARTRCQAVATVVRGASELS